jgi:hypothetical protein
MFDALAESIPDRLLVNQLILIRPVSRRDLKVLTRNPCFLAARIWPSLSFALLHCIENTRNHIRISSEGVAYTCTPVGATIAQVSDLVRRALFAVSESRNERATARFNKLIGKSFL